MIDAVKKLAAEFTHERWGSFEVGATPEQRALCRYLRAAAITMATALREKR